MGEAKRRGTYEQRKANPKGKTGQSMKLSRFIKTRLRSIVDTKGK